MHRAALPLIALAIFTWRTLFFNHRVQKLAPDGTFVTEWKGPDTGFYGPRRIAVGPDNSLYVVDQGRTQIVKFSPDGRVLATWGSAGSGDGQFNDHTSVAVDPATGKVFVADPRNSRIQVFEAVVRRIGDAFNPIELVALQLGMTGMFFTSNNMF